MRTAQWACLILIVLSWPAGAQNDAATMVGTVKDSTGSIVVGAHINIQKISTNETFSAVTNATGDYRVFPLPLGEFKIKAEFPGFKTDVRTGVVLQVGSVQRVDFDMVVGETSQSVEVSGNATLLHTENATVGQVVDSAKLAGLPINNRDFASLAALIPGVAPPRGSVYGTGVASGTLTGIQVRGLSRDDNAFHLDGTLIQDGNSATSFRPSVDALQEVAIKTGLYGAEYGIRPGGQIVAVVKSGTNAIHGNAFEFYRSNDISARNFFALTKTDYQRHQVGGTVGGPVVIPGVVSGKDKLWFFASFQEEIIRTFIPLTGIVPTDALKAGQFPTGIKDPTTGQPFPNNLIPANLINPVSAKLLKYWPAPNTPGALNFTSPDSSADTNEPQIMARVDYRRSDTDRWAASMAWNASAILTTNAISTFSYPQPQRSWVGQLTNTRNFGTSVVNIAGMHFFRRPYALGQHNPHVQEEIALGIPALQLGRVNPSGGLPVVNTTGYLSFGDSGGPPGGAANLGNWQMKDDLSFQKSSHFVKVGVEFRKNYNLYNLTTAPTFNFTNRYTGNPFADFLLGFPSTTASGGEAIRGRFAQNDVYAYIQDDWKISQRLTLNLGLRYELRLPWKDRRGFMSNYNPYAGQFTPALQNLTLQPWETGRFLPDVPLVEWYKNGLLPRAGLAYRANNKTVVRVGYGMYANDLDVTVMQALGQQPRPGAQVQVFNASAATPTISLSDPYPAALAASAIPGRIGVQTPLKLTVTHSWGLSVEREITRDIAASIGYQGSHTSNLLNNVSINDATPGPGARQSRRPYPDLQQIDVTQPSGDAWYDALQVQIEKRPGPAGLYLLGAFTWSKTLSTVDFNTNILGQQRERSRNMTLALNKSNAGTDVPFRFVTTVGYQVPFGKGKRFLTHGALGKVLGGWEAQGIFSAQSGGWFTALLPGDPLDTGSTFSQWPNLVKNPNLDSSARTPKRWFDTTAFVAPPQYTYGNAGHAPLLGPGLINVDLSLQRNIAITERQRLQLRCDSFNTANHPIFNIPGQSFGTGAFGVVGSALDPRILQFGLKYMF